jgi:ankyrin repeat protein
MSDNQSSDLSDSCDSLSSLLLIAAKKGRFSAVRALLKSCADHSAEDCEGNTPLLLAVSAGDTKSVQRLLRSGASLDKINSYGEGDPFLSFDQNAHLH